MSDEAKQERNVDSEWFYSNGDYTGCGLWETNADVTASTSEKTDGETGSEKTGE